MTNVEDVNGGNLFHAGGQAPFVVFTRSYCCCIFLCIHIECYIPWNICRPPNIPSDSCASFDKLEVYTAVSISILECDIMYFGRTLSCFGGIFCLNLQGKKEFAVGIGRKEVYCFTQGLRPRSSSF
jgi:hypothetical protein